MNILIANTHSTANPGDTAIVDATLQLIRELAPETRLSIISRTPRRDKEYYKSLDCEVYPSFPNLDKTGSNYFITAMIVMLSSPFSFWHLLNAVRRCDMMLLCGGGYYYSYKKHLPGLSFMSNLTPIVLARLFRKKIISLPQSYGPFKSIIGRRLFQYVLHSCTQIYCREKISLKYIHQKYKLRNAFLCPDLAFYLSGYNKRNTADRPFNEESITVGITVRRWMNTDLVLRSIVAAMKHASVKHAIKRIKIIVQVRGPQRNDDDLESSITLLDLFRQVLPYIDTQVYYNKGPFLVNELMDIYGSCDLVIGMRFHSVIMAMLSGIPAIAVGYQHKSTGIMKYMGLDKFVIDSSAITDVSKMTNAIDQILHDYSASITLVRRAVKDVRKEIYESLGRSLIVHREQTL